MVSNRPTRLNENDHSLDAMEYMIGSDLLNFASNEYLTTNKVLKTNYSQGSTR